MTDWAALQQLSLRDVVLLLPFAQLLPLARQVLDDFIAAREREGARLVTSWSTTEADVDRFAHVLSGSAVMMRSS